VFHYTFMSEFMLQYAIFMRELTPQYVTFMRESAFRRGVRRSRTEALARELRRVKPGGRGVMRWRAEALAQGKWAEIYECLRAGFMVQI